MQEQQRADQERLQKLKEQRIAPEEKNRRDLQRMSQELPTVRAPAATSTSVDHLPTLKTIFKEFSGEPDQAQRCALG